MSDSRSTPVDESTEKPSVHPGVALAVIAGAQLMVVLDATIVNIALPHIQEALGFSRTSLAWVLNAYTLTFGGLLLLGGRAGDILGRRRMFIVGVVVFAGASLLGGFATTEAWLLTARVIQGIGGAIASPTALSLVTTTFKEGVERNRAFGVYAAVSGAGAAIGLILGGLLTDLLSWRWVLFVNVPIGAVLALAAPYVLPESERRPGRFDLPGALTSTFGVASLVYGFIHAATNGWSNSVTMASFGLAVVLLAAFILIERTTRQPLMPMSLFSSRSRSGTYVVMLLTAAGLFAVFFFLVQFVQDVLGYSAIKAGFAFLPVSAAVVVSAQIASRMVIRTGAKFLIAIGAIAMGAGMLWFSRITVDTGYLTLLLPAMVVLGIGLGFIFVPITITAVGGVEHEDAGIASAMLNVMQQVGGTLGLSALVTVSATATTNFLHASNPATTPGGPGALLLEAITHGWAVSFLFAAAFAAIALVVDLVTVDSSREAAALPGGAAAG